MSSRNVVIIHLPCYDVTLSWKPLNFNISVSIYSPTCLCANTTEYTVYIHNIQYKTNGITFFVDTRLSSVNIFALFLIIHIMVFFNVYLSESDLSKKTQVFVMVWYWYCFACMIVLRWRTCVSWTGHQARERPALGPFTFQPHTPSLSRTTQRHARRPG